MNYQLQVNDKISLTTTSNETYSAIVLGIGKSDIFVNLLGFGKLSIKWKDIWSIQKILIPNCHGIASYGPTYKVSVYQSQNPNKTAS